MLVFDFQFEVAAPVEAVREFHHDTTALKKLSPPLTFVRLHKVEPLEEGSVSEFTLWFGPLPIRWEAVHRDVSDAGFTDVQRSGPALQWEHTHRFTAIDVGRTLVQEHIEYAHRPGLRGVLTRVLFARAGLSLLFTWRKISTRWHLRGVGHAA